MKERNFGTAVRMEDKAEKGDLYSQMRRSAYPLLYAMSEDLSNAHMWKDRWGVRPAFKLIPSRFIDRYVKVDNAVQVLAQQNVPHVVTSDMEELHFIEYSKYDDRVSSANLHALDEDQMKVFRDGLMEITYTLADIPQMDTLTSQVNFAYNKHFSELHPRFNLLKAGHSVIDGVISTYLAAAWLSQQPVEGMEELGPQERLIAALESDAITEMTRKSGLGILTLVSTLGVLPEHQLTKSPNGTDIVLHDNAKDFLEVMSDNFALDVKVPFPCPILAPLGDTPSEKVINDYKGDLPEPVVASIRRNSKVSGIKTASRAVASLLRNKA